MVLFLFFSPITKAQKSFLLCGEPNVGKSTILTVLQEHLLGADNVSNIPLQNLSDRFQPAELFGKMANIYADLPSKKIDDASMFKAVTGEDFISGERKHKDPFSFKPFARFMYSCNDIPRNYGDRSEAFYRRLIIIRFSKKVPADKRDFNLVDKLSLERDGILLWAIEGLKRLIANNYQFTETNRTKAEVQAYRIQKQLMRNLCGNSAWRFSPPDKAVGEATTEVSPDTITEPTPDAPQADATLEDETANVA